MKTLSKPLADRFKTWVMAHPHYRRGVLRMAEVRGTAAADSEERLAQRPTATKDAQAEGRMRADGLGLAAVSCARGCWVACRVTSRQPSTATCR
jgi:ferric-dicitrate binding protein FerR (iron transport regulator)